MCFKILSGGRGRIDGENEGEEIRLIYFICLYENTTV
jgi:hypothetical protein